MKRRLAWLLGIVFLLSGCGSGDSGGGGERTDRDCSDFATQQDAQAYFDQNGGSPSNNVDGLDADRDGIACESLPKRTSGNFSPMNVGDEHIYVLGSVTDIENQTVVEERIINDMSAFGVAHYHPSTDGPTLNPMPIYFYSYENGDFIEHREVPRGSGVYQSNLIWKTHVVKGERFKRRRCNGCQEETIEVLDVSEDGLITFGEHQFVNSEPVFTRTFIKKDWGIVRECRDRGTLDAQPGTCTTTRLLIWYNCEKYPSALGMSPDCADDFWR
jgi:hypothetical protein